MINAWKHRVEQRKQELLEAEHKRLELVTTAFPLRNQTTRPCTTADLLMPVVANSWAGIKRTIYRKSQQPGISELLPHQKEMMAWMSPSAEIMFKQGRRLR